MPSNYSNSCAGSSWGTALPMRDMSTGGGESVRESIFDGIIEVRTIPHNQQRYDTVGDWWTDEEGWHIRVSYLGNWRYNFLVAFHELLECAWCKQRGVSEAAVTFHDIGFEKNRRPGDLSEPGDDPRAPYRVGHQFASLVERFAAFALGVEWGAYEAAVNALEYRPQPQ